jgi:hypothetical protein
MLVLHTDLCAKANTGEGGQTGGEGPKAEAKIIGWSASRPKMNK